MNKMKKGLKIRARADKIIPANPVTFSMISICRSVGSLLPISKVSPAYV